MRVRRFLMWALPLVAVACAGVYFIQPEKRLAQPDVAATVEIRVVPRFAPTAESAHDQILSESALAAVWSRIRGVEPETSEPSVLDERAAEIAVWRQHLSVEIEPNFDGDRRRIQVRWSAANVTAEAARIVESLASRYAGDLAAAQWYDVVDPLRRAERDVNVAGTKLLEALATSPSVAPDAGAPLAASLAELRRKFDSVVVPREAEFPVVATAVTGLHLGHSRASWYILAGTVGLGLAALMTMLTSVALAAGDEPANLPAVESRAPVVERIAAVVPPTPAIGVNIDVDEARLRTAADVERAVKAPVVAEVRLRRAPA